MPSTNYSHSIPILPVSDLEKTVKFYKEYLGFTASWISEHPKTKAGVSRDGLNLIFVLNPEHVKQINSERFRFELYLLVTNVEEVYHELKEKGVPIHDYLQFTPHNNQEFSIVDCNGYLLRFSEEIEYESMISALSAAK